MPSGSDEQKVASTKNVSENMLQTGAVDNPCKNGQPGDLRWKTQFVDLSLSAIHPSMRELSCAVHQRTHHEKEPLPIFVDFQSNIHHSLETRRSICRAHSGKAASFKWNQVKLRPAASPAQPGDPMIPELSVS